MSGRATRWARRLAWGVSIPVGLLAVLHVTVLFAFPLAYMTRALNDELGLPVRIASVDARVLPYPRMRLHSVEIGDAVSAEHGEIVLRILPLLRGKLEGARASLRDVELHVTRNAGGSIATDGFTKAPGSADETKPVEGAPWTIPSLPPIHIRDLVIHYLDHTARGGTATTDVYLSRAELRTDHAADAVELSAEGRLDATGGEPTLQLTASLGNAARGGKRPVRISIQTHRIDPSVVPRHLPEDWGVRSAQGVLDATIDLTWNDPAGFDGRLDLHLATGEADYAGIRVAGETHFQAKLHDAGEFRLTDGVARTERARLESVEASDATARFAYRDRTVTFAELSMGLWDGTASGRGTLALGPPLAFDVQLDAKGIGVHHLRFSDAAKAPEGPALLDVRGPVSGQWAGRTNWLERVQGTLDVSMSGGQLPSEDIVRSLVLALPNHFGHLHDPDHRATMESSPIERIGAHFSLADGRAQTNDLQAVTQGYSIAAHGWMDGDGAYSFKGGLTFTPAGLSRLLAAAAIRGRHEERGGLLKCPFAVSGSFQTGKFSVDLDDQPLTALVILPWTVDQVSNTTAGAYEAGQRGVGETVDLFRGLGHQKPEEGEAP